MEPSEVPGHLSIREGEWLATAATCQLVVEIGSYKGRSTCFLARTARFLYAVEAFCGQGHLRAGKQPKDWAAIEAEWHSHISACQVRQRVQLLEMKSSRAYHLLSCHLTNRAGLIFVDGGHYEFSLRVDVCYANLLRVGGVMAFHDYHNCAYPDVRSVVDRWYFRHRTSLEHIDGVDRIRAFRVRSPFITPLDWLRDS